MCNCKLLLALSCVRYWPHSCWAVNFFPCHFLCSHHADHVGQRRPRVYSAALIFLFSQYWQNHRSKANKEMHSGVMKCLSFRLDWIKAHHRNGGLWNAREAHASNCRKINFMFSPFCSGFVNHLGTQTVQPMTKVGKQQQYEQRVTVTTFMNGFCLWFGIDEYSFISLSNTQSLP